MFKFKGLSTESFSIIVEEELNLKKKASIKYEATDISGRNGSVYEESGYADVEITLKLQLLDINKLDSIYSWLNGEGILEYEDKKTIARIYAEQNPTRVGNIYVIEITIIRNPFWYLIDDEYITVTDTIENKGNIISSPIIRLEKEASENVDLTVNDVRFKYNFNNDSYVEFDCESCDALMNGLNRNNSIEIGFEIPKLNPGINQIKFNLGSCIVKIKRKDRFL